MRLPVLEASAARDPATPATGPRSIAAVQMLRISVTDRCNFRCVYCMPAQGVPWLSRDELLTFEEIERLVGLSLTRHGIRHIKLTGGEPTVRSKLSDLVTRLRRLLDAEGGGQLSMTTNGFSLVDLADPLRHAGLDRVTVSLDSLQPDRFRAITRTGRLAEVMAGIERSLDAGLAPVKINCVVIRGTNDDELADFASLTLRWPVTVRFIEYMPMGYSALLETSRSFETQEHEGRISYRIAADETGPAGGCGKQDRGNDVFVAEPEMRRQIESALGPLIPVERSTEAGVGPAIPWQLNRPDAIGRIGFISAMSQPFCGTCNRLRLTATGILRSCLFEGGEVNLRDLLRSGAGDEAVSAAMVKCVAMKPVVHSAHGNIQMSRIGG